MPAQRNIVLRLSEPMATDLALVAAVEGRAQVSVVREAIANYIAAWRAAQTPTKGPTVTDPLAPTHELRLAAPTMTIVAVTDENITAIARSLGAELIAAGGKGGKPYITFRLSSGVRHDLEAGDYFVQLPEGIWPIAVEDIGPLFIVEPLPKAE